ncbi:MAG: DUF2806 domain-containing protein [Sulfuricella sp.]
MMIEFKDIAGLSKPLTRLIEVISEGIGAVSRPYLVKKNAEAKAHEVRVISAALKDVAEQHKLPVIYKEGVIEIWQKPEDRTLTLAELSSQDRTSLRLDYQERKRQQNIESITSVTAAELAHQEVVPDDKPDEDWITRFFSSAQDVSSEQMQDLWGRILAGEIKKPGTYSLKTLEFIKNITKKDASLLEHVGKLAVQKAGTTFVAMHDKNWLEENRQIYPSHLFAMGELGVMYPTELALKTFREDSIQEEFFITISGDLILLVNRGEIKGEIQLPIWKFTSIGQELLELIHRDPDEAFLESLGRFYVERKGAALLAKVVERLPNGQINYSTIREICSPPASSEMNGVNGVSSRRAD